jgi:hypothetical protein
MGYFGFEVPGLSYLTKTLVWDCDIACKDVVVVYVKDLLAAQ